MAQHEMWGAKHTHTHTLWHDTGHVSTLCRTAQDRRHNESAVGVCYQVQGGTQLACPARRTRTGSNGLMLLSTLNRLNCLACAGSTLGAGRGLC